ncbi:MAG TPA: EAL domain-containing protein [Hyphomonadaceae bacterium]|nr:EAL domain-containing protein [Hyphomonadaceae bacterium]HPI46635.1 EAL domain-containing protein [Hyphomonadaceae bacterium]
MEAEGDAMLLHHPTADRLIGRSAIDLISEAEGSRLREELWALAPGRRLSWEDTCSIEGGRRIVVQRNSNSPNSFNFIISRMPSSGRVRGDRMDEIMAERFRDAVMNGRLMAARQPVVETRSGAVSHYEVLARFNGEDSPVSLIAAAEKSGQIAHLDYIMISAAAAQLEANLDPDFRLAVNISGESLQRLEVISELCAVISGHVFHRSRLIVEVTESAHIHDIETAARAVSKLRSSGISVSLDDFGAGSASFGYLRALDVDGLKFDGSFLQSSETNLRGLALMRNVARMCAELGITSVGERIETESDRALLLEAGVKYAQGYFYGRPIIDENFFARSPRSLRSAA